MSKVYKDEKKGTEIVMSTQARTRLANKPYASGFIIHLHECLQQVGADWAYVSKQGRNGVEISVVWHS